MLVETRKVATADELLNLRMVGIFKASLPY